MRTTGARLGWMTALALAVAGFALPAAAAENLLENPSFELTQNADMYGNLFPKWSNWKWEGESSLEVGRVAHTGKTSALLAGDTAPIIRIMSAEKDLEPGRYRVTAWIRGLGIGTGKWNMTTELVFNGKYLQLKKNGTFGWTKLTYVADVKEKKKFFQPQFGLMASGLLWVDDVSLEKVGEDVPLTDQPVLDKEEAPIAAPGPLGVAPVRCPFCAFLSNRDWKQCYACGHDLPTTEKNDLPPVKIIADFESGKPAPFSSGKIVAENPVNGKFSLESDKPFEIRGPQEWSGYQYLKFDVFNPSDESVPLNLVIRDAGDRGYWTWVNYGTVAVPGKSTISLPTDMYVGEKSRPGRPLMSDKVTQLYLSPGGKLLFDDFRLEKLDATVAQFPGLLALSFGPMSAPVLEGYTRATCAMTYAPGRGFGWDKAQIWRPWNYLQPDPLYQSFIGLFGGGFRVDLPNGKYHVIMNLDMPGGFWGEVQAVRSRSVTANSETVVDDKMDVDAFAKHYFRNASRDDLPGIDTFNTYVQTMFDIKQFDVEVTDGKLNLGFKGDGPFAISLSTLVIYPADKTAEGKKFWDWTTERRKVHFTDYFKQVLPRPTGAASPAADYVLFSRSCMEPVNASDGPREGEALGPDGLSLTVCPGEEAPLTFSLQPAGDPGKIDLAVSDLAFAGPMKRPVGPIKADCVKTGWLDFRITRVNTDGTVYRCEPRYWHPTPAAAGAKVTRTFWLRVKPPAGTPAGPYKGTITVKPANAAAKTIPVTVNVLPFALDPITDVSVGPFGIGMRLPWIGDDPKTAEWGWQMYEKSLEALHDGGCTAFTGIPSIKFKAKDGKIELDTTLADKQMAAARAKGFNRMICGYGGGVAGYNAYGTDAGPDDAPAKAGGFASAEAFLKALYSAIDEHAIAADWLPVAYNLCDEPIGDAKIHGEALNALAHRKAAEGLKRTTFMGETSMKGDGTKDAHGELVKALPIASLNLHDEKAIKVATDAGNTFSFYNGTTRWTMGRYMKMLVVKYKMDLRMNWYFCAAAGDPYYALDTREDDYCWFNTDAEQMMVPSTSFLTKVVAGLNDYRYLSTLERLIKEKAGTPAAAQAQKVFDEMMNLTPDKDRAEPKDPKDYDRQRAEVVKAILLLVNAK